MAQWLRYRNLNRQKPDSNNDAAVFVELWGSSYAARCSSSFNGMNNYLAIIDSCGYLCTNRLRARSKASKRGGGCVPLNRSGWE